MFTPYLRQPGPVNQRFASLTAPGGLAAPARADARLAARPGVIPAQRSAAPRAIPPSITSHSHKPLALTQHSTSTLRRAATRYRAPAAHAGCLSQGLVSLAFAALYVQTHARRETNQPRETSTLRNRASANARARMRLYVQTRARLARALALPALTQRGSRRLMAIAGNSGPGGPKRPGPQILISHHHLSARHLADISTASR
jgi:hypothetical protein